MAAKYDHALMGEFIHKARFPPRTTEAFTPLGAGLIMEETFVGLRHRA